MERFPLVLANLRRAVRSLPLVIADDISDLDRPFREIAVFERGRLVRRADPLPEWLPRT